MLAVLMIAVLMIAVLMIVLVFFRMFHLPLRFGNI
jgi:hypothetical protein